MTKRNPTLRGFLSGNYSKQAVFDFVRQKVNEQGKPSMVDNRCAYRSEDGCKCAAGHLVTDRDMKMALENDEEVNGGGIHSLLYALDIAPSHRVEQVNFIRSLQNAHDDSAYDDTVVSGRSSNEKFIEQYNEKMDALAAEHNLKV